MLTCLPGLKDPKDEVGFNFSNNACLLARRMRFKFKVYKDDPHGLAVWNINTVVTIHVIEVVGWVVGTLESVVCNVPTH